MAVDGCCARCRSSTFKSHGWSRRRKRYKTARDLMTVQDIFEMAKIRRQGYVRIRKDT